MGAAATAPDRALPAGPAFFPAGSAAVVTPVDFPAPPADLVPAVLVARPAGRVASSPGWPAVRPDLPERATCRPALSPIGDPTDSAASSAVTPDAAAPAGPLTPARFGPAATPGTVAARPGPAAAGGPAAGSPTGAAGASSGWMYSS